MAGRTPPTPACCVLEANRKNRTMQVINTMATKANKPPSANMRQLCRRFLKHQTVSSDNNQGQFSVSFSYFPSPSINCHLLKHFNKTFSVCKNVIAWRLQDVIAMVLLVNYDEKKEIMEGTKSETQVSVNCIIGGGGR